MKLFFGLIEIDSGSVPYIIISTLIACITFLFYSVITHYPENTKASAEWYQATSPAERGMR